MSDAAIIGGETYDIGGAQSVAAARATLEAQGQTVIDRSTYAGPNQVSLRVRFVEASRRDMRRLGLDLSALGDSAAGPLRSAGTLGAGWTGVFAVEVERAAAHRDVRSLAHVDLLNSELLCTISPCCG